MVSTLCGLLSDLDIEYFIFITDGGSSITLNKWCDISLDIVS